MGEKVLGGAVLAVCVLMLVRLGLGERLRERVDAALLRFGAACRRLARRPGQWHRSRQASQAAEREAQEAIRRARTRAQRDQNVIRPESFRKPRKPH